MLLPTQALSPRARQLPPSTPSTRAVPREMTINTKATKRILIIDDLPRVLDVLLDILASFRHEHAYEITTNSVGDAFGILQRERFRPDSVGHGAAGNRQPRSPRQGLDVLKRVRELRVQTPVVMISGDCGSRKEADALTEGEFGYVHKPFDVREMDRVVAKAIVTPA